jgi:ABC-type bacteriocin/lantibiotic exporter with double-glycine peptidase domain
VIRARLYLSAAVLAAAAGCYTGSARDVSASERLEATRDASWLVVDDVPFVPQHADGDCGPAALAMVLGHFGVDVAAADIVDREGAGAPGVRAGTLRDVARAKGLEAFVVSGTFEDLFAQLERGRPVLVGVAKPIAVGQARPHYEVVVGINRRARLIRSLDPARGLRENSLEGFAREWVPTRQVTIVVFPPARHAVL